MIISRPRAAPSPIPTKFMLLSLCLLGCSTAPSPSSPPPLEVGDCGVPDLVPHTCKPPGPSTSRGVAAQAVFTDIAFPNNPECGPQNSPPLPCDGPFRPTALVQHPVDEHWYLVEQTGRILRFSGQDSKAELVLDIAERVVFGFEPGLLNLAFDPKSPTDAYLWYTTCSEDPANLKHCADQHERMHGEDLSLFIVLSRMKLRADGHLDPDSEQVLLSMPTQTVHFGHGPLFDPNGLLYVGIGDGHEVGSAGPRDLSKLQGKILRIDVHTEDGARISKSPHYRVPADNPHTADSGARPEIFARGLRNPWRMAVEKSDPPTLLVADVGDATMEEVSRVVAGSDLGWPVMEGTACRNPDRIDAMTVLRDCSPPEGLTAPLHAYPQSQGISIVGGVVYRGRAMADLTGDYLYADLMRGALTRMDPDGATSRLLDLDILTTTFATDLAGEVYLADLVSGGIFQLVPGEIPRPPPASLRETGCVDMDHPSRPAPGGIALDIALPAFTEPGVSASRTLFLPNSGKVKRTDNELSLPPGSVLVQHHSAEGLAIETRLLSLHEDGAWSGWAYRWNGTEATRVDGAIDANIEPDSGEIRWHHPAPGECSDCHRGGSLAFTPQQLGAATLKTLACLDRFEGVTETDSLAGPDASLEDRVGAYLEVNCRHCHTPGLPGGRARGYFLLAKGAFRSACGQRPQMGIYDDPESRILLGGDPDHSLLLRRMLETELPYGMPPYRHGVDSAGTALVRSWLDQAADCEAR